MSVLIKNTLLNGIGQDILIEGDRIAKIAPVIQTPADCERIIDGANTAAVPGFHNCHTHSAMTVFRGYGDDLPLMKWLEEYIWPVEAKMTEEDCYWGARLACLEMIKSGTTAFMDMYMNPHSTAQAAVDTGMRAVVSYTLFDQGSEERAAKDRDNSLKYLYEFQEMYPDTIRFSVGPHAIYTVSGEQLRFCHNFAKEHDVIIHLHMSETKGEVDECMKLHNTTPIRYLDRLGVLSPNLTIAHGLWMDEEELDLLAANGVNVIHNPASNMKLASGYKFFYEEMRSRGIDVGLGTDGCSSSNNLDMLEAMKLASLLGKVWRYDSTAVSAPEIFRSATETGACILRTGAGKLEVGYKADLCLVDLSLPEMTPLHDLTSNLVYSANGSCVKTTVINGRIVMLDRVVEGEEEIKEKVRAIARRLIKR
ncbi:5-methylthioadenosine/S-adenosylhomocysteine deaminase [Porphyromonas macacae]|uniref:5-methylthioadenosine/S-adenosylhomocysteine deaminase n=1 Tax=Porphyromonas macacae TaxID=28115 RepID=A0A379E800_9PORP|nr:amidohydrolase [Porphyromonas macacae]SUB88813.1 5-methylthioadenosine/S-adenosylhomocysteine deaminase [Porphyromonas macacae]